MEKLSDVYKRALKEKEVILTKLKPLRRKEVRLQTRVSRITKKLVSVRERIVQIENNDGLADLSKTIAVLAPNAKRLIT